MDMTGLEPLMMPVGGVSLPPLGYVEFCIKSPDECRSVPVATLAASAPEILAVTCAASGCGAAGKAAEAARTPDLAFVAGVNAAVNRSMGARPDFDVYGVEERWAVGQLWGDCEDFALTKRKRLVEAGVPEKVLSLATARLADGQLHTVLIYRDQSGEWVLDNLTDEVLPWQAARMTFLSRQSEQNPAVWLAVGGPQRAISMR